MVTFQWYLLGTRYPIFETVETYSFRTDSLKREFTTSFYYTKEDRERLTKDSANINALQDYNDATNMLISCNIYPNPVRNVVFVDYELSVESTVSFILCDVVGRAWSKINEKTLSAGLQKQVIPMNGLPLGNYVLHIKVNNNVFQKKIIKQ